jgi:lipopolysaccharide export LptBFGC system permease protein LptF
MATILALAALILSILYFILQAKRKQKLFNEAVSMQVNYLFQEGPGQYSGDYRTKSGVFVFQTERKDNELKNMVIKQVKPDHSALVVNLEQIVVIPFENKREGNSDVSVRFKLLKKNGEITTLEGKGIRIAGVLNFANRKPKAFSTLLKIGELYQLKELSDQAK